MVDLAPGFPWQQALPLSIGAVTLAGPEIAHITAILPFRGQRAPLSKALKTAHGLGFPAPGRSNGTARTRILWSGHDEALLLGPPPAPQLAEHAALVDQSDGWALLRLEGADARAVLARLCPLDLRAGAFKRGHAARSLLGHMPLCLVKTGAARFDLLVFRSMAGSAIETLRGAMTAVAARRAIGSTF